MSHSRLIAVAGLVGSALFAIAAPLMGGTIPADALPIPNRVAVADSIVIGKVTAFGDQNVAVAPFRGAKNKVEYKIAIVTVNDVLMAPKGTKMVRLGFVPTPPGVAISPRPFEPALGQEGCFFLTRHGVGDFQVAPSPLNFIDKKNDKDMALVKRCTKILADADAALKSKSADDRFLAAAMLVARYRTSRGPKAKSEAIDAAQSKLILQALAGADWTPKKDFTQLSPLMALQRLPLTKDDGWAPPSPQDQKAYAAYARQWLMDHAGRYRIQRLVAE